MQANNRSFIERREMSLISKKSDIYFCTCGSGGDGVQGKSLFLGRYFDYSKTIALDLFILLFCLDRYNL